MSTAREDALDRMIDWGEPVEIVTPPKAEGVVEAKSLAPFESDLDAVLGIADDLTRQAALALLAKHLPGKHDQSTHGRGAGIRPSLKQAKTTDEVASVVSARASAVVGDTVTANFDGADVAVARDFGEGILRGVERYPATPLRHVGTFGPGTHPGIGDRGHNERLLIHDTSSQTATAVGIRGGEGDGHGGVYRALDAKLPNGNSTSGTSIYLSTQHGTPASFQSRARIREMEQQGRLQGRSHVTVTPRDVALHEFGHSIGVHGRPSMPEYAVGQAARAKAVKTGTDVKSLVRHGVSHYAKTDDAELAAEVFTDVMANGSKATSLSKELFKVFDANVKGWEAEVT